MDGRAWRCKLVEYGDQAPLAQVLADFPQGAPGQALASQRPVVQHGAVIAFERTATAHRVRLAIDDELPSARLVRLGPECQAAMPGQPARMPRRAVPPEGGRAGGDGPAGGGRPDRGAARGLPAARAE